MELNNKLDQKSFEIITKHNLGYVSDEDYKREELKTRIAEAEK